MAEQIIKNPSITPGDLNLELSGGYVTAISGHPVGGTGGGGHSVVYSGVVGEITVDNQQGTIGLADEVKGQLSSIPSKVSDLSDSANYYTSEQVDTEIANKIANIDYTQIGGLVGQLDSKQNKLTFGYDDSAISSINGSAIAGQNDMSQYALKNDLDVVSGEVDILTDTSAKWNEVSAKFDTSSWNAYSGKFQLSGDYATKSDLDLYYKKTETSSKDEISDAIKDFITDADVTAKNYLTKASGDLYYLPNPTELLEGTQYAYTTQGWSPIQGGGGASGISFVNHDETLKGDGNTVKLGIDTTATINLTNASAKSAVSAATANVAVYYYDEEMGGNFKIAHDINHLASQISDLSGITTDLSSNKLDTTAAAETYQAKGDYATNTLVQNTSAAITALIPSTTGLASKTDLQNVSAGVDAVSGELSHYYKKSETSAATEISTALGDKVDKPSSTLQNKYLVLRTNSGGFVDGWVDVNANIYSKTESDGRYQKKEDMDSYLTIAKYATDSATFITETELETVSGEITALIPTNYVTSGNEISGNDQYALTTAGWSKITGGSVGDYVPFSATELPIGTNNTATQTAAAIGISNTASVGSFALGKENTATNTACAIGSANSAGNGSFVAGRRSTAYDASVAFEESNYASGRAVAFGHSNTAKNYSYTFGRGLGYTGPVTDQWNMGAFVVGCWNNTTTWDYTNNSAGSPLFIVGNGASDSNTKDAFIVYRNGAIKAGSDTTAKESNSVAFGTLSQASGNCAFVAGAWCTAIGQGAHAEGNSCGTTGYGNHIQGSFNKFESTGTEYNGPANTPVFVGGILNATTAQNYNDHGGYLQIMGNGTYQSQGSGIRSDAYILYRDGSISAAGKISANGMFAVDSAATLIGASRQTSENYGVNNSAIGTTWFGVGSNGMHQGFIKYTDGGDVGALDTTSTIQLNFKPSTNNFDSVQVQINGNSVGYLIPAVTSTTTAGLTDDGILHIIIES